MVQLSHPYMTTGKTIAFQLYGPLLAKWCLCFDHITFPSMGTNNSDLLSRSMVEDATLPPGALMAKFQHLPPYTSCWRPPASDTDRTVSPLGTSSAWQSPTQLSSFDQSISSSYSHPLNLLHDALLLPLFSLPVWSLCLIIPACLSRHLTLLIQPRLSNTLNFSLVLPSSVLPAVPILSPGKPFFSHTFDPGSLSDDDRMADNSSQCFQNHSASRGFFGFSYARHYPKFEKWSNRQNWKFQGLMEFPSY